MVLPFQEHVISDLLSDPSGGLVIISSGLSLPSLVSSLLSLHNPSSGSLLLLNYNPRRSPALAPQPNDPNTKYSRSPVLAPASVSLTSNPNPDNSRSHVPAPLIRDPNLNNSHGSTFDPLTRDPSPDNSRSLAPAPASLTCDANPEDSSPHDHVPAPAPRIGEITADLPAHRRLALYSTGAPLHVTSRILIVDLLTGRLRPDAVAGVLLMNVHTISESSTEAFIVRLLRLGNRGIYVWAFSDKPQAMVAGFAKTERIMRCLYLRKLHLWPRFQVYVSQDLERDPPEVVDIRVPMSPHMKVIQKSVIEVMDSCLKEMRKTNKVDVEDLTVENGLFKSFDEIVRRQLDPIWHTLGKKTKQLVSDLKTLRKLLDYLVRYDAVTYLKYLDSLRASESFRSVWIFAESSYKIFEYAKKRVYHFKRLDGEQLMGKNKALKSNKKRKVEGGYEKEDSLPATSSSEVVLEEVLEEAPKWKVLRVSQKFCKK